MFKLSDIIGGFSPEFESGVNPLVYNESLAKVRALIQEALQKKIDGPALDKSIKSVIYHFHPHEEVLLNSFFHIKNSNDFLFMHILNIMFLSCSILRWLEFSEDQIAKAGIISFFIDISLASEESGNILKQTTITLAQEQNIIKRHAIVVAHPNGADGRVGRAGKQAIEDRVDLFKALHHG